MNTLEFCKVCMAFPEGSQAVSMDWESNRKDLITVFEYDSETKEVKIYQKPKVSGIKQNHGKNR